MIKEYHYFFQYQVEINCGMHNMLNFEAVIFSRILISFSSMALNPINIL